MIERFNEPVNDFRNEDTSFSKLENGRELRSSDVAEGNQCSPKNGFTPRKRLDSNSVAGNETQKREMETAVELPSILAPHSVESPPSPHDKEPSIVVYRTRFWILGVFSLIAFIEFNVWGTFGPIMQSAEYAFNWKEGYIALLDAWGPIDSVLFMVPLSWFNQKYGLRKGVLATASLVTIATAARCITTNDVAFTYLASFAAITNGMSSSLTQSIPAMISTTWFPPKERTTATAIGILIGQIAASGMYCTPLLVRAPPVEGDQPTREEVKSDIRTLMFIHFGISVVALLCALVYFPAKPKNPPSISSSEAKVEYFKSVKTLFRTRDFVLVTIVYVLVYTFPMLWFGIMNFSLQCIGIEQGETMYIAITASLVSAVAALVAARLTDRLQGYMKLSAACLVSVSSAFFIWFLLMTEKVILISSKVPVYFAITGGVAISYASVPIIIELAVELAYPCPESVVGAFLVFFMDSVGIIFLLLMIIPSECFRWLSYVLVIGMLSSLVPLIVIKEDRKRSAVDAEQTSESL